MLVKFFDQGNVKKNHCVGGDGAKNYLLSAKRVKNGTAILMRGDADVTTQIINGIRSQGQIYTSGCLAFDYEEYQHLTEINKHKIMQSFENVLFPGLEPHQFSGYWIQHTDKVDEQGQPRLELNFVYANVELTTDKAMTVYFTDIDNKRIDAWKEITNYEYDLADPNAPERKQLFKIDHKQPLSNKILQQQITNVILEKISNGLIDNHEQVKQAITDLGLEIVSLKRDRNQINIKNPFKDGSSPSIPLKGAIYEKQFDVEQIRRDYQRQPHENRATAKREREQRVAKARTTLERELSKRQQRLADRYANPNRKAQSENHRIPATVADPYQASSDNVGEFQPTTGIGQAQGNSTSKLGANSSGSNPILQPTSNIYSTNQADTQGIPATNPTRPGQAEAGKPTANTTSPTANTTKKSLVEFNQLDVDGADFTAAVVRRVGQFDNKIHDSRSHHVHDVKFVTYRDVSPQSKQLRGTRQSNTTRELNPVNFTRIHDGKRLQQSARATTASSIISIIYRITDYAFDTFQQLTEQYRDWKQEQYRQRSGIDSAKRATENTCENLNRTQSDNHKIESGVDKCVQSTTNTNSRLTRSLQITRNFNQRLQHAYQKLNRQKTQQELQELQKQLREEERIAIQKRQEQQRLMNEKLLKQLREEDRLQEQQRAIEEHKVLEEKAEAELRAKKNAENPKPTMPESPKRKM